MQCPECNGVGGFVAYGDGWDEWDDCHCCGGTGACTPERHAAYRAAIAADEARIDAMLNEPCARCGVPVALCECGASWSTVH